MTPGAGKFASTGSASIGSVRCCLLFDPADGAIQHVHRIVTMKGADEPDMAALEQRTLAMARALGVNVHGLELLHVHPQSFEPGKTYVVDASSRRLRAIEAPARA